jgi:hypothetical protein
MADTPYPTRLKQILETEGRTQAWLAKQVGCTRSMVCEWANDSRTCTERWHTPVALALGRNVSDVFPQSERRQAA